MTRLRDALNAVTNRIGKAVTATLFPEDTGEKDTRVIDVAPMPPRGGSQRRRRRPPMEAVMPRMGYRYHLSWTPPEGIVKRWWRTATRRPQVDRTRASPDPTLI
jgi:hypothetical protein